MNNACIRTFSSLLVFSLCLWRSMWNSCWRDCLGFWRLVSSSPPLHSKSTPGQFTHLRSSISAMTTCTILPLPPLSPLSLPYPPLSLPHSLSIPLCLSSPLSLIPSPPLLCSLPLSLQPPASLPGSVSTLSATGSPGDSSGLPT